MLGAVKVQDFLIFGALVLGCAHGQGLRLSDVLRPATEEEALTVCEAQRDCGLDIGLGVASCEELYADQAVLTTDLEVRASRLRLRGQLTCARYWDSYLRAKRGDDE